MRLVPSLVVLAFALASPAIAQQGAPVLKRTKQLDHEHTPYSSPVPRSAIGRSGIIGAGSGRPAILLTGYWPPSNEMLRRFSTDPGKNPLGWVGADWEGRGYDVYAHFPEFIPANCTSCGIGLGELQVDYQATTTDFWAIANALQPIAIITFSRGSNDLSWEVEMNQFNRATWVNDFLEPLQPTPAPPDAGLPAEALRPSIMPVQEIVDAVDAANLGLSAFICFSGSGGGFLSEFIAYLGVWYQSIHADPQDPAWCVAAGHVHVGREIPWATAKEAAEITVRTVMDYVDEITGCSGSTSIYCTTSPNSVGAGALIGSAGDPSLSTNQFDLSVAGAVPGQFGIFFYGTPRTPVAFGDGWRCVGSPLSRFLPPILVDGTGAAARALDVTVPPLASGPSAAVIGVSQGFQFWYRDPAGLGAGFNVSDALEVTWCP